MKLIKRAPILTYGTVKGKAVLSRVLAKSLLRSRIRLQRIAAKNVVAVPLSPQVIFVNASADAIQRSVKISQEYRTVHGTDGDFILEDA